MMTRADTGVRLTGDSSNDVTLKPCETDPDNFVDIIQDNDVLRIHRDDMPSFIGELRRWWDDQEKR